MSLAALVYLGQLSVRMLGGEELQLIETEQRYACDSLGLRLRVPAGYTALETSGEPETETTYAHYNISTYNQDIGINIEGVIGSSTRRKSNRPPTWRNTARTGTRSITTPAS